MKNFDLSSKVFGWMTAIAALCAILWILWQAQEVVMGIYGVILLSPAWLGFAGALGFIAAAVHRLLNLAAAKRLDTPPQSDGDGNTSPRSDGKGPNRLIVTAILSCCISSVIMLVVQNHHFLLYQQLSSFFANAFMLWALIWVVSFCFVFAVFIAARRLTGRGQNHPA